MSFAIIISIVVLAFAILTWMLYLYGKQFERYIFLQNEETHRLQIGRLYHNGTVYFETTNEWIKLSREQLAEVRQVYEEINAVPKVNKTEVK